ncbi:hypothetical protein [Halorubrum salinum]|uniref:transcriptional regulator FilR1 domain-containing protein n=1 Tax=Halorubrum salinum TaxID=767517 RepID=UPI002AA29AD0|nr:hypothetical protein [Halorubrum salinum]
MADDGPGAALRSLVERAVDGGDGGDRATDDRSVAVTERGDDPGPVGVLSTVVAETGSSSIVGVVPRLDATTVRRLRDAVDGGDPDRTVRLVFTGLAAERLSGRSGAVFRAALARRGIEVAVHAAESSVAVLLVGERAVVGLFDGDGLAALLSTDAPEVRTWAAGVYRRYAAAAAGDDVDDQPDDIGDHAADDTDAAAADDADAPNADAPNADERP